MMLFATATILALASGAAATHDVAPAPDIPFTSAESPFGVTTRQRTGGILVETVASDSKSVGASLFEPLEETYASECFVDYDEDTGEPITEPCEESCGGYSYFLNGYVMVGDEKEISVEVTYSSVCDGDDDDYTTIDWSGCATVKVPPGTWDQTSNMAKVKLSATLQDCGYHSADGAPPGDNPLVGKTIKADFKIRCDILSENASACIYTSSDESSKSRSLNIFQDTNCFKEDVKGLTFDGVKKTWDTANFGTSRSRDRTVSYKRKQVRERKRREHGGERPQRLARHSRN